MFNILPVRKLIKVITPKRGVAKRDRASISLTEDLGKNVVEQRLWQICFCVFILLVTCVIHFLSSYCNIQKTYEFPVFKSSEEANKSYPVNSSDETLPICFVDVQKFGNVSVNKTVTEISETDYAAVQRGGFYTPGDCRSRHKVALLVPYRNRKEHLATFLFNIHPFLMKQNLEYRIFIIEQEGIALFNRGRVFNAGYKEAMKFGNWKCVVFHDVDLLPLDGRILYSCPMWPRHMCASILEVTDPSFRTVFGGVSAMTVDHFEKVNGFSNLYWGWGGEDTDLFWRIHTHGLPVVANSRKIARYTSLNHSKQVENHLRYELLRTARKRCYTDGLSSLKYTVESVTLHHLYTHILVDINPPYDYKAFMTDRASISLTEDLGKNVVEQRLWQICFCVFILLVTCVIHFLSSYCNIQKTYEFPVFKSSEEANKSYPVNSSDETLPICFVDVQKFGNVSVNKTVTEISETDYAAVQRGGFYTPGDCRSRHKVALLVPYRNRKEHLATFLFNIHPFLMKQNLEYRIFIIEQEGIALFNRGRVFNAGYKEAMKFGNWKCVVFHDVDLLPLDGRILYSCPMWPRHMCASILEVTDPSFRTVFGGVSAMTVDHFEKVNGFSNLYWGWGGEDTDLFWRIHTHGLPVVANSRKIARYTSLNHSKQVENHLRYELLRTARKRCYTDGLSSLKYTVESVTLHHLYTHILVDINPPYDYKAFMT